MSFLALPVFVLIVCLALLPVSFQVSGHVIAVPMQMSCLCFTIFPFLKDMRCSPLPFSVTLCFPCVTVPELFLILYIPYACLILFTLDIAKHVWTFARVHVAN